MSRLLAPTLGVLLLAALIGCGGGGTAPSFDQDPDTTGGTTSTVTTGGTDTGGTTDLRPTAGSYTVRLAGGAGATTFTGTGTASAASSGAVTVNVLAANSSDTTARTASVTVAQNGLATGTVTVGTAPAATITAGSIAQQSSGVYLLTTTFTSASALTETDRFTLTLGPTVYTGPNAGTDNQGAVYSGSGSATLTTGNALGLTYASTRGGSATATFAHSLSTTLLSDGTFTGGLDVGDQTVPATGTWTLNNTTGVLRLTLTYVNVNYVSSSGLSPTATETLTLTKG